jgi:hypothetical protein
MFAVVAEQTIPVFADPRACAPDDLSRFKADMLVLPHPHAMVVGKTIDRHLLHRTPLESTCECAVVHNLASADVDPVMGEAKARRYQVRARNRLFTVGKQTIASDHVVKVSVHVHASGCAGATTAIRTRSTCSRVVATNHTFLLPDSCESAAWIPVRAPTDTNL